MDKSVKLTNENYQKIYEIAKHQRRTRKSILAKAISNYYNVTIGNTIKN